MRKIVNPFTKIGGDGYQCFGCSPHNPIGMHLQFWEDGDEVFAHYIPEKKLEGYNSVLHGGIQALLLDEVASWVIYAKCGTAGVTSGLDIRYKKPVYINGDTIIVKGRVKEIKRNLAYIQTQVVNEAGDVFAEGVVTYFLFPEKIAKEKYHYPGVEAFFEEVPYQI